MALFYSVVDPANPTESIDRIRIGSTDVLVEGNIFSNPPLGISEEIGGIYGMDYDAPTLNVGMRLNTAGGGILRGFFGGTVAASTSWVSGAWAT